MRLWLETGSGGDCLRARKPQSKSPDILRVRAFGATTTVGSPYLSGWSQPDRYPKALGSRLTNGVMLAEPPCQLASSASIAPVIATVTRCAV